MKENEWDLIAFLDRSKHRRTILELLEVPKTPTRIKEETGLHFNTISRAILELEKKDLIKCLNPLQKLSRFYQIKSKGKDILNKFKKLN